MSRVLESLYLSNMLICFILIVIVAFLILIERKALAAAQRRLGPSILGRRGVLQIIADVVKPLFKEKLLRKSTVTATLGIIVLCYLLSQTICAVMYSGVGASSVAALGEFIIILQVICGSLACLFIIYIGYFSGSKYSFMGSVRSLISESSNDTAALFIFLVVFCLSNGTSYSALFILLGIIIFIFIIFIAMFIILFYVFIMAQRSPADLIENEGELVAGYNLEYSAADLLVIYFAEYFHLFNSGYQYIYIYCSFIFGLCTTIYLVSHCISLQLPCTYITALQIHSIVNLIILGLIIYRCAGLYKEYWRQKYRQCGGLRNIIIFLLLASMLIFFAVSVVLVNYTLIHETICNILNRILYILFWYGYVSGLQYIDYFLVVLHDVLNQPEINDMIKVLFAASSWELCDHFTGEIDDTPSRLLCIFFIYFITRWLNYVASPAVYLDLTDVSILEDEVWKITWWIFGSDTPVEPKKVYNPWEGYEGIIYPSDIFISFFIYMAIVCMYLIIYISVISKTWGAPYKRSNFVWIFVWALLTFGFGYFWIRCYFFGYESLWAFRQIFTTLQMTLHYLGMYYLNHLMFGNFVCYGILHLPIALLVDNLLKDFLTKELRIFLWIAAILVLLGYIVYLGPEYLIYTSVLKNQALLCWFPINGCPYDVTDILLGRSFACTVLCGFLWRLASGLPELFWLDSMTDAQGRLTGYSSQDHLGAMPFIWPWYICTRLYARERPWLPKFKKAYCNAFWHGWLGFAICVIVNFTIFGACGWYLWSL